MKLTQSQVQLINENRTPFFLTTVRYLCWRTNNCRKIERWPSCWTVRSLSMKHCHSLRRPMFECDWCDCRGTWIMPTHYYLLWAMTQSLTLIDKYSTPFQLCASFMPQDIDRDCYLSEKACVDHLAQNLITPNTAEHTGKLNPSPPAYITNS